MIKTWYYPEREFIFCSYIETRTVRLAYAERCRWKSAWFPPERGEEASERRQTFGLNCGNLCVCRSCRDSGKGEKNVTSTYLQKCMLVFLPKLLQSFIKVCFSPRPEYISVCKQSKIRTDSCSAERKKKKSRLLPLPAQEARFSFSSHMAAHKLEQKVSLAGI